MEPVELPVYVSHGSTNAYINYHCRCDPCREAHSAYRSERRGLDPTRRATTYMAEYMREYRAGKRRRPTA